MRNFCFLTSTRGLVLAALTGMMWGCSDIGPMNESSEVLSIPDPILTYYEKPVYHADTESWIIPAKDPYALDNFREAYRNIATGKSAQTLSPNIETVFPEAQLKATHYAVKIYPRTEEEQRELELMNDISVSYTPFGYMQLPESQTTVLKGRETASSLPSEDRQHSVTYTGCETTHGPMPDVTYLLPILYTVWPCGKPFPEEMDYEVAYEVFLPNAIYNEAQTKGAASDSEVMQALEREAIDIALYNSSTRGTERAWSASPARGSVHNYDYFLKKKVPMVRLKVRYQLGTSIWNAFTNSEGQYYINSNVPAEAQVSYVFEHPKWKITYEGKTTPITITWGTHYDFYNKETCPGSSHPDFEIHRAIEFYHFGWHNVPQYNYTSGIRIEALGYEHPKFDGAFVYNGRDHGYLVISNKYRDQSNYLLGAVFHELGHFAQYLMKGYTSYQNTNLTLKESWGSYTGWQIADSYYVEHGYVKISPTESIVQDRQTWSWKTGSEYSPLFIDLRDDYNQRQRRNNPDYPNDYLKDVPFSILDKIAGDSSDWAGCKRILNTYAGSYYSSGELLAFYLAYDNYFNK